MASQMAENLVTFSGSPFSFKSITTIELIESNRNLGKVNLNAGRAGPQLRPFVDVSIANIL